LNFCGWPLYIYMTTSKKYNKKFDYKFQFHLFGVELI
jgi:hypothetical protein